MLVLFRFGWGKPVQFDPFNLRNPKRDTTIISLAGPVSNIIMAITASLILRVLNTGFLPLPEVALSLIFVFLMQLTVVNVVLAIFNLLPIHPLDGFKIVGGLLPDHYHRQWMELERYGMIFLIALLLPIFGSPITRIISPPINFILQLLLPVGNFI
jgi:Zn-dependent protease